MATPQWEPVPLEPGDCSAWRWRIQLLGEWLQVFEFCGGTYYRYQRHFTVRLGVATDADTAKREVITHLRREAMAMLEATEGLV